MSSSTDQLNEFTDREYKYGFVTDIESDTVPPGLNEDIIRKISAIKEEPDWLTEWRLDAFRHWQTLTEPTWPHVKYNQVDFQDLIYYSAPKPKKKLDSLDEVDPELLETFEKLGIPLDEQKRLTGVAVDAVFDSVSVATTFQDKLAELGIIFCSFSEAVKEHPELVRKYLGSVVPVKDNFYATLNSAVFSDGSFCYVPKGVRCPMELSTYFRINAANTGQFERTLLIADEGANVSYLEGCTAPMRDENQLHAAVVELVALEDAEIKYNVYKALEAMLGPEVDRETLLRTVGGATQEFVRKVARLKHSVSRNTLILERRSWRRTSSGSATRLRECWQTSWVCRVLRLTRRLCWQKLRQSAVTRRRRRSRRLRLQSL